MAGLGGAAGWWLSCRCQQTALGVAGGVLVADALSKTFVGARKP
jgi:hypothetical protein